jgi:hypothetical protein
MYGQVDFMNDEKNEIDLESEKQATGTPDETVNPIMHEEKRIISSIQAMMMSTSPGSALADKVDSSHITQMLKNDESESQRIFKNQQENRILTIVLVVLSLLFVFGFCWAFKSDKDMIEEIVMPFAALFIGGFGGYGFGKTKR